MPYSVQKYRLAAHLPVLHCCADRWIYHRVCNSWLAQCQTKLILGSTENARVAIRDANGGLLVEIE